MNSSSAAEPVIVGRILGAHGVKGWVKLSSFTEPKTNLLEYSPWLLLQDGQHRSVVPLHSRVQGSALIAQLPGVEDRDQAAALRGVLIAVDSTALPATEEDEFYWKDLIGLTVLGPSGDRLGRVVELVATGANDVLVVEIDDDGARELIPFHRSVVTAVNLAAGTLTVDWAIGDML